MFISFVNNEFVKFLYDPLMSSKYVRQVKTLQAKPQNDIHCVLTNPTQPNFTFFRLAFHPNQISSVFAGFSWSHHDLHHSELLRCNFEVSLWCRECQELSSVESSECCQHTRDGSDSIHQSVLPNLRCKRWIFVDPAPIPVGQRSRLCEVEIVDLWPGRFAFGHIDMTQTIPGLCLQHKIDLAAPVTWLGGPQCRKRHSDPEVPVHLCFHCPSFVLNRCGQLNSYLCGMGWTISRLVVMSGFGGSPFFSSPGDHRVVRDCPCPCFA